jgi:hypothetical protein
MMTVELRITRLPNKASASRKSLPFAVLKGSDIIITSALAKDAPLNDHLVWLWGMVKLERRYLKSLRAEGAEITVHANGVRGPIKIKSNGAEMLHLLDANLVINVIGGK